MCSPTRVSARFLSGRVNRCFYETNFSVDAVAKPGSASAKISSLVDEISKLTLLEVADLNEALKVQMNFSTIIFYLLMVRRRS